MVATNSAMMPWPTGVAADLHLALGLDDRDMVALLGDRRVPGGRYGIVGLPQEMTILHPTTWPAAFDAKGRMRVLLLGYELGATHMGLAAHPPPAGQPAGLAVDLRAWLVADHETHTYCLAGPCATGRAELAALLAALPPRPMSPGRAVLTPCVTDAQHACRLQQVLDHIAAGDIYQGNLTRRLAVQGTVNPLGALSALSAVNPVAHAALVRCAGVTLLSNSMETLLTFHPETRLARTYPIKGTQARGHDACSDEKAARALVHDRKEQAEHVMIVDLARNDLGRFAVPGGVRVPRLMAVEAYRGVWHSVSTIEATMPENLPLSCLVRALFPGGSITGAPKRRAIELLRDIEVTPRGFYTGSLALLQPNGALCMSILIRTLVHDAAGWGLNVGGGIVADSHAAREIAETWEKADVFRGLFGGA